MPTIDDLRQVLKDREQSPPPLESILARIDQAGAARAHRHRRPAWTRSSPIVAVAAVVVVVIVAIASTALARQLDRHPIDTAVNSPRAPVSLGATRPVTVHGLTIDIPTNWTMTARNCEPGWFRGPAASWMTFYSPQPACVSESSAGPSTVSFAEGKNFHGVRLQPDSKRGNRFLTATVKDSTYIQANEVTVTITSVDPALRAALADTVRLVDTDANGCPAEITTGFDLQRDQAPSRPGASDTLVPGKPAALSACRYHGGWIISSARLPSASAGPIIQAFNSAPSGYSVPNRTPAQAKGMCRLTPRGQVSGPDSEDDFLSRFIFSYPLGASVTVTVRIGLCGSLGAANGARSVQLTNTIVTEVATVLSTGEGLGVKLIPHR